MDTLIRLALRLRSINTTPTLLSSTVFDFNFNLLQIIETAPGRRPASLLSGPPRAECGLALHHQQPAGITFGTALGFKEIWIDGFLHFGLPLNFRIADYLRIYNPKE